MGFSFTSITMPEERNENHYNVPAVRRLGLEIHEDNELSELNDEGHSPVAHDADSPLTVEHQADDKLVESESIHITHEEQQDVPTDDVGDDDVASENSEVEFSDEGFEDDQDDQDDNEGTCVGREGAPHESFEFSEPAGPATL